MNIRFSIHTKIKVHIGIDICSSSDINLNIISVVFHHRKHPAQRLRWLCRVGGGLAQEHSTAVLGLDMPELLHGGVLGFGGQCV